MAAESTFLIDDQVHDQDDLFTGIDQSADWFVLDSSLDRISEFQNLMSIYSDLDAVQVILRGCTGATNSFSCALDITSLDTIGNADSSTGPGDSTWLELGSTHALIAGDTSHAIDTNNDGMIGELSSIELPVCDLPAAENTENELVPIICICWREEDLNALEKLLNDQATIDNLFIGNGDENALISDTGHGQVQDADNDELAVNSTTLINIDAIVNFVDATDTMDKVFFGTDGYEAVTPEQIIWIGVTTPLPTAYTDLVMTA